ncbi:ran guanine nucleotide release factor isoform X2 [Paramisgurnus dabryanus]|uniref:ran guanine nucleotide release factor isoform X2 n=1 Tax=Paramisgurnus dabryanus TaxID=90735 RepID=UPI0031F3590D
MLKAVNVSLTGHGKNVTVFEVFWLNLLFHHCTGKHRYGSASIRWSIISCYSIQCPGYQTDQSIIIELLEYQSHVQGAEAVRYHFDDVAASNGAVESGSWKITGVEQLTQSELLLQECSSAWLLSGAQLVSKFNEEAKNTVNIYLCLFRLPQFTTDILVTFNDPVCINPLSSSAAGYVAAVPWTLQDFQNVLQSFHLLNPGVFG